MIRILFCQQTCEILKKRNLDAFWKEVSSLCNVVGGGKTGSQLVNNTFARRQSLGPQSEDTNHSKTAVLKFLQSLLFVLFGGVAESERVVTSFALSNAEVASLVASTLFLDDLQTTEFKEGSEEEDLEKGKSWNLVECLQGVGVAVSIKTSPLVSRKSSEKTGGDETNGSKLSNTSVDELGLAVPGQIIRESIASLKSLEPRANRYSRETKGIETDISQHGAIEGGRGSGEGKGGGRTSVSPGFGGRRGSSNL